MRRQGRFVGLLSGALVLGWGVSWVAPRLPASLAEVDWFRVRGLVVAGTRYLEAGEVERTAALPADANLWHDFAPVAERLREHPMVQDVRIERRLSGKLLVRIEEREPVALLPTPTLEPVDREGRPIPLDPARHRLDLPLIYPGRALPRARVSAAIAAAGREAARLSRAGPEFWADVSVVIADGGRAVTLEWGDAAVRIRAPIPLTQRQLREAMAILRDATDRTGGRPPVSLDLRFADQVVVRHGGLD